MKIDKPAPFDVWQRIAAGCPWATYFHTPQWASCIVKTFPEYSISGIGFILDDTTQVVFPAVARVKKRLLHSKTEYKSMEPGVYGGFISAQPLSSGQIQELAAALLAMKNSSGRIVQSPFTTFNLPSLFKSKQLSTHMIDLEPGFDGIAKKFSRGQKSNINQAKRKGVMVRRAAEENDIEQYYALYQETIKRWGKEAGAVYPKELFLNLYRQNDQNVQFWLAEVDQRIIAGIIVLAWNTHLVYWHGSALHEFFKHYPNNLIHATVLRWACDNGFTRYDMGPSMDLPGVIKFKETFGARPVSFSSYRWR